MSIGRSNLNRIYIMTFEIQAPSNEVQSTHYCTLEFRISYTLNWAHVFNFTCFQFIFRPRHINTLCCSQLTKNMHHLLEIFFLFFNILDRSMLIRFSIQLNKALFTNMRTDNIIFYAAIPQLLIDI